MSPVPAGSSTNPRPASQPEPVERIGRRLGPGAEPVAESEIGISREAEHGRKIAGEVGDTGGPSPGEHERGGRGHDRGPGAALGRPEANEHERLPGVGRARRAHASNTGKALGKVRAP